MLPAPRTEEGRPRPVPIHEHAYENLRAIREIMERAGSFTAVPGWGGVAMGVAGLGGAWIASRQETPRGWLTAWLATAAVAAAIGAAAMLRKARKAGVALASGPGSRFLASLATPILVGAVLTVALAASGVERFLPGVWLLLYGLAIMSGGVLSIRIVRVMGVLFLVIGTAALFAPRGFGDLFLAAGFGILQIAFGVVIARRHGG